MRIAVAQIDVALFDVAANLEKHRQMIDLARVDGAELLVFPELSLTGYSVGPRGWEIGMSLDDPRLLELAERAGDMRVVVGFVEEAYAAQFHCAAAVLHGGHIQFVHRKLNLATYGAMEEAKYFASGRYVETFPMQEHFVGAVLLCADMWNPALVHLAALHGATALIVPTNSSLDMSSGDFSKPMTWDTVLQFYSMIYGLPIAFANRVGTEGDYDFWGGSRILGTHGRVIAEAGQDEETLLFGEWDYRDVRRARFELPTVRDSNLELVHREIERLLGRLGVPSRVRDT